MLLLFATLWMPSIVNPPKLQATPFPLSAVRLLGGPFERAHQATAKYLLELDPKRLLAGFRVNSGLKPNAEIYGGWETGGLSGHSLGHYLTACSQEYARTADPRFKSKVDEIVAGLGECQRARGDGFLMAFRFESGFDKARLEKIWAAVAAGDIKTGGFDLNGMWSPWYVHHKVLAGLLDADEYCHSPEALHVAGRFADWAVSETKNLTPSQWQKMLGCEYGGMNEALAELYTRTRNPRYLDLARKFYDRHVLDPLADAKDDLAGKHSNTQIPKVIGLARLFEIGGEKRYEDSARFFWDRVVNHRSYAIGGNSNGEYLGPPDQLAHRLSTNTCETCNTYNMLKLTRHLFEWQPEASDMDFYERAYFNHILGSQDPDTGGVTYFMPLSTGAHRNFSSPFNDFTCCHGTGMENHTKHGDTAYFHAGSDTLWVNLFMPTELSWNEAGLKLRQDTNFPTSGRVRITIESGHHAFTMLVRHPGWAPGPVQFRVNGQEVLSSSQPASYAKIKRDWQPGDQLEFELPMPLYQLPMPDDPNRVALMRGPIVLAADLGPTDGPMPRTPVLVTNDQPITTWLTPFVGKQGEFLVTMASRPEPLHLVPFYEAIHDRYAVYFDKFTEEHWDAAEAAYRAEEQHQLELQARTIDQFTIGEMQPERDHHLQSARNDLRESNGRSFRTPLPGGWMSFVMRVDPTKPTDLVLSHWGNDRLSPVYDVVVDGDTVATETLEGKPHNKVYDVTYAIPSMLTAGKQTVTVRIQPHEGRPGPSLVGARTCRRA